MTEKIDPCPKGYHTVTPGLTLRDCKKAMDFYEKAFGAKRRMSMEGPGGKVMHAAMQIGDSIVFLADEFLEMPDGCRAPQTLKGTTGSLYLYVPEVDKAFARAIKAGAKQGAPPTDMFWGDRQALVIDPWEHLWNLATHVKDPPRAEIKKGQEEWLAQTASR